jgi:hypothetical protein
MPERNILKKLIVAMLLVLAMSLGAAPATRALETFVGTIAEMETQEEDIAVTVITENGDSLILLLDPAEVEDLKLQKGDRVRVSTEGEDIQSLEKL